MGGRTYTTHLIPAAFTKPAMCGLFFARMVLIVKHAPARHPGTVRNVPRAAQRAAGRLSPDRGPRFPAIATRTVAREPGARSPRKKPVSPRHPEHGPRAAHPGTWAAHPGNFPGSPGQSRQFPAIAPGPPAQKSRFFQNYYKTRTSADFTQTTGSQNKCL